MNAKTLTSTLSFLAFAFGSLAAPGCAVDTGESKPEGAQSTSEADTTSGGGVDAPYTCTDAGFCQCTGASNCASMATSGKCRSDTWYCNYGDLSPMRCSCLAHAEAPPKPKPIGGGTVHVPPVAVSP